MTKAEKVFQDLEDMGVEVVTLPGLMNRKAIACADGLVAVAPLETDSERNTVLTHEKWHFKLGAFYHSNAPYEVRCRTEAAVNRAALRELVPKETLRTLLRQGLTVDEIADRLDVTEDQIWEAWRYYRSEDAHFCSSGE